VIPCRSGEASPAGCYGKCQVEDHHLFQIVAEEFRSFAPQTTSTTGAPPRLTIKSTAGIPAGY